MLLKIFKIVSSKADTGKKCLTQVSCPEQHNIMVSLTPASLPLYLTPSLLYGILLFFFLTLFLMFIFEIERDRQTDRQSVSGEGQRVKETQNPKQAPGSELSAQSPKRGSNPRTARSRPEPKSDA